MDRFHQDDISDRSQGRRHRQRPRAEGRRRRPHSLPLTEEGIPAAVPGAPPVSPTVFVTEESRRRFPWLPGRVIAGSVWRGPGADRVRVDEHGEATYWRCRPAAS